MQKIKYNSSYIYNVNLFSKEEKARLHYISDACYDFFLQSKSLQKALGFDFVYTSAKIEGNRYSIKEAEVLFTTGYPASNRQYADATMLTNLQEVYDFIMADQDLAVSFNTACDLHYLIAQKLLARELQGRARSHTVTISGSDYIPLTQGTLLESETKHIFEIYKTIEEPFDRALYIHNNVAYLQYFADCNKRTARALQLLSMKNDRLLPLILVDINNDALIQSYRDCLVQYYETGLYTKTKEFFVNAYEDLGEYISNIEQQQHFAKLTDPFYIVMVAQDDINLMTIRERYERFGNTLASCFKVTDEDVKNNAQLFVNCSVYKSYKDYLNNKKLDMTVSNNVTDAFN